MFIRLISELVSQYWPWMLAVALTLYLLNNKYGNGLQKYPGPLVASFTNWWRFLDAYKKRAEYTFIGLHRKHGDIVRLGPNVLSFANPQCIRDIYGLNKGYTKTEFYPVQTNIFEGERITSLFNSLDEKYHALLRRHVSSAFAMSNLVSYEPLVDETTSVFLRETEKLFAQTHTACDLSRWLQFYAFDVIGEITFSKRLGFIESNEDVDGIIKAISWMFAYSGPIGQVPWLDRYFLMKNPLKMWLMKKGLISSTNPVSAFASRRAAERVADIEAAKVDGLTDPDAKENLKGVDILTRLLHSQKTSPGFMTDEKVLSVCTSLINAGSDTTAISLSSIFYFLLKHPYAYEKLMREIDLLEETGIVTPTEEGLFGWADSQKMPYLDAVIQESFRMHPAAGLMLERHVPPEGAVICGERIPGNTIVGANAWVLHRRPEIFGEDVDTFRPERWLKDDAESLKEMRATMFQFGAGPRTCIGRHISTLEMYKLVPTMLRKFTFELADPTKEWRTSNVWFVQQHDFNVRIKPRALK